MTDTVLAEMKQFMKGTLQLLPIKLNEYLKKKLTKTTKWVIQYFLLLPNKSHTVRLSAQGKWLEMLPPWIHNPQ
jgi:hypothetical protein